MYLYLHVPVFTCTSRLTRHQEDKAEKRLKLTLTLTLLGRQQEDETERALKEAAALRNEANQATEARKGLVDAANPNPNPNWRHKKAW